MYQLAMTNYNVYCIILDIKDALFLLKCSFQVISPHKKKQNKKKTCNFHSDENLNVVCV